MAGPKECTNVDDRRGRSGGMRMGVGGGIGGLALLLLVSWFTSAQRGEWFRRGLTTGKPDACDTFAR